MKNLTWMAFALLIACVSLAPSPVEQGQDCRARIQLENTQFSSSAWVHPQLVSLGPDVVYLVHVSDGGLDFSVEHVSDQSRVLPIQKAELIGVARKKLATRTRKHTFAKQELLAVDWREVATEQSADGSEYVVPAGAYRFSILFSQTYPVWSGKMIQVCRAYSETFVLKDDSKWGTDYSK
jgi:hypothetical protein